MNHGISNIRTPEYHVVTMCLPEPWKLIIFFFFSFEPCVRNTHRRIVMLKSETGFIYSAVTSNNPSFFTEFKGLLFCFQYFSPVSPRQLSTCIDRRQSQSRSTYNFGVEHSTKGEANCTVFSLKETTPSIFRLVARSEFYFYYEIYWPILGPYGGWGC